MLDCRPKYLDGVVPRVGNDSIEVAGPALGYGSRAAELDAVVPRDRAEKPDPREMSATDTDTASGIGKVLYAVVAGVGDINSDVRVEVDRRRPAERSVGRAGRSERARKGAVGAKELDAVVAGVGDYERAVPIKHVHILRRRELAGAVAACPQFEGEGAVGMEGLYAVVAGVGDVDHAEGLAAGIYMNARRPVKLPVAVAAPSKPERKGAVGVKDLYAVVAGVGYVDSPVVQQDYALRRREMPGGRQLRHGLGIHGIIRRHGREEQRQRGGRNQHGQRPAARDAGHVGGARPPAYNSVGRRRQHAMRGTTGAPAPGRAQIRKAQSPRRQGPQIVIQR